MARLLVGVSGGIAAYKALEAVRLATKAGHAVRVIQTPASERFVGRASFEALTGAPVLVSEFEPDPARGAYPGEQVAAHAPISHLALAQRAELYLIAPASANTLAKLAHGHADNLLTAAALAASCPLLVAPAMNDRMYAHPATQANIAALEARGVVVLPPGEGELASHGERGTGRLPEPAQLLEACEALLHPDRGSWTGMRVLVTAGGTREPLDSVRYIGNRSSGRMGLALAARAAARGADVVLVAANVGLPIPARVRSVEVQTAAELKAACELESSSAEVPLMAAAVADFRPAHPVAHKLRKAELAGRAPTIELEQTDDVIASLASTANARQVLVGFAAEHGEAAVRHAREKLELKGLDAVVVNDVSRPGVGFESAENEVVIVTSRGDRSVPRASKERVADAVLDEVERLRSSKREEEDIGSARADARSAARI
jgi:phosphopantothenoylcysteine decarboxylase / phosphopantothenate---cysteine ligase